MPLTSSPIRQSHDVDKTLSPMAAEQLTISKLNQGQTKAISQPIAIHLAGSGNIPQKLTSVSNTDLLSVQSLRYEAAVKKMLCCKDKKIS